MMGFGQAAIMPLSWIGGVLAVALVWGCVWMLLAVIGIAPRRGGVRSDESTANVLTPRTTWQQPDFGAGSDPTEAVGDRSAVRDGDEQR
ncbi:MAG TPA: hypothetical protein VLS51_06320 [Propionibacteriaceae bacterium]|nr:hypothetical protein [Propionibacteriaceae bacterium]